MSNLSNKVKAVLKEAFPFFNLQEEYFINYKGNKCSKCGYNKCIQALELHHKNPEEKEFTINNAIMVKNYKFKNIKKEVDKCILVCANCHREIHYTWRIKNDK